MDVIYEWKVLLKTNGDAHGHSQKLIRKNWNEIKAILKKENDREYKSSYNDYSIVFLQAKVEPKLVLLVRVWVSHVKKWFESLSNQSNSVSFVVLSIH